MDLTRICQRFPSENDCIRHLEKLRWNGRPVCPRCAMSCSTPHPEELRYRCRHCRYSYSVMVGTMFSGSHVSLQKWFLAIAIVSGQGRGRVAGRGLASMIGVTKNTACNIINRIEFAVLDEGERTLLSAIIAEFDPEHPLLTMRIVPGGRAQDQRRANVTS